VTAPTWTPCPPYASPPADDLPPGARALLNRIQARIEQDMALYPEFAKAVREDAKSIAAQFRTDTAA
jgi:hypothetical protein